MNFVLNHASTISSPGGNSYKIIKYIGGGGFGYVFRALDISTNEDVAIKVVPLAGIQEHRVEPQKLLQEVNLTRQAYSCAAEWVAKLKESFVLQLDNGVGEGIILVMDLIDGGSPDRIVNIQPMDESVVAHIMNEILLALSRLHQGKLIHRDLKGSNVLVSSTGKVLLCDFGTTRRLEQGAANTLTGTPYWMAPEVAKKHFNPDALGYNHKADIWGLGVTAVELVTGEPVTTATIGLDQKGPGAVMFRIATCKESCVLPEVAKARELTQEFQEFVRSCLQIDPIGRPEADDLLKSPWIKKMLPQNPRELLGSIVKKFVPIQTVEEALAEESKEIDRLEKEALDEGSHQLHIVRERDRTVMMPPGGGGDASMTFVAK
eukprot:GHVL01027452.1.p1 GENE.GHVL01027452.1~~GHVL01027452.1.p1  ORF type:complete len:376 (+),score=69.95 GHVL01027452.1:80-1207(+)